MTCASCANRIERKLNKLDGVTATVNYATETASIEYERRDRARAADRRRRGRRLPAQPCRPPKPNPARQPSRDPAAGLRARLIISAVLSVPVLLIAMISALQFDNWQWLSLQLATPVVLWGAWPFHRAAWANLKHASATMDTLISVGTLSAWLWSLYALFLGDAGDNGMRMVFNLIPSSGGGANEIYLETASIVTTFILAGRYFEARAKRRAGAALKALLELGAKDVAILEDDGSERRAQVDQLQVGQRFIVRPGEKVATDGIVEDGHSAIDMSMLTGESIPVEVGPGSEVAGATINAGGRLIVQRHPNRQRHRARPDRPARHRGTDRQGTGAAARRPHLRDLRPDRLHDRRRDPRLLARHRAEPDVRVHRRGRRPDHRLPLRARARHADRADGRHRPRRPARAADQGPGDPRIDPTDRHDRARQDRHRHDRADDSARCRRRGRHRPRRGAAARRRARGRLRAPDRSRDRHRRQGRVATPGRSKGSRIARDSASRASSTDTPSSPAGPPCSRTGRIHLPARARRRTAGGRGSRSDRDRRRLGRTSRPPCSSSPTPSSRPPPRRSCG